MEEPRGLAGAAGKPSWLVDHDLLANALHGIRGAQQRRIAEEGLRVTSLLLRKNRDYGGSVFGPPVLCPSMEVQRALLVRMSDKIARLATLSGGQPGEVAESIEETIRDLAGYCIIYLANGTEADDETEGEAVL